jgi:hypothetical protein
VSFLLTASGVSSGSNFRHFSFFVHEVSIWLLICNVTGGLDWTGEDSTGLDWTGQDRSGQDWTGLDWTGQDRTGQDRTGQN